MQKPEMTTYEFDDMFPNEASCRQYLFDMKYPKGFVCPKCGHDGYYEVKSCKRIQCKECRHQTSITAGTIFHKTRTPLRIWFKIINMVAKDKRGVSALAISRDFPISYPTAWTILHKIRKAMGNRDQNYVLNGIVEVDDGYFGTETHNKKRGRGTEKAKVLVSVSVNENNKARYAKMDVVDDLIKDTLHSKIKNNIEKESIIEYDGYPSYSGIDSLSYEHTKHNASEEDISEILKGVHTLISNVKAFITGTYHGVAKKHLQSYLSEYCYRFNRRFWHNQLFGRLLDVCINSQPITFAALTL